MPFEIEEHDDCLVLRLLGVLTSEDVLRAAAEVQRLEEGPLKAKNRITDLTSLEDFEIGFAEVWKVAQRRSQLTFAAPIKSAIIARRPIHVGFARMFQTLLDNPQIEVRIVDSLEEARNWFASSS